MKNKPALAFIGSGNTAWSLGTAFKAAGYSIAGIASRNAKTGKSLAKSLKTVFTNTETLLEEADICFICVQDRFIKEVAAELPATNALIVHCSGSASLDELKNQKHSGVFYPVISMRSGRRMSFKDVPVCIEADQAANQRIMKQLGKSIEARVIVMNSLQRQQLHLAAVFVNNFSNACFTAAEDITSNAGINFSLLKPLLEESLQLMQTHRPSESQTGPAKRNDTIILRKQLSLLKEMPEHRQLYKAMSAFIRNRHA
jgi:predicted short-subunit dehydrogenase-like oxidoreductase (DUF2520 family)